MSEHRFSDLAAYVMGLAPRLGAVRLVAVDGPSGAGKTWFAGQLAAALGAPVVHTDDLLKGWDDQFTFWTRLEEKVLAPLRKGETAAYHPYDWGEADFTAPAVAVDPGKVVLLEGVSAARREIRPELTYAVFVDAPSIIRWDRAISRDGDDSLAYRKYLERWRAAEDRHFVVDETAMHADLLVDGTATAPDGRYVSLARTGWAR